MISFPYSSADEGSVECISCHRLLLSFRDFELCHVLEHVIFEHVILCMNFLRLKGCIRAV